MSKLNKEKEDEVKIIATSAKGDGMLPMKQSGDIESNKSFEQKNQELCNFIKNAFCADGDVTLAQSTKKNAMFISREFFIVEDSKRGKFLVAIKQI